MNTSSYEELERIASQPSSEEARQKLAALREQERQQEQLDRAAFEAGRLETELATALANFQPQKQESDSEFAARVQALKAICKRRLELGGGIFQIAERLAEAQLSCGLKRSPLAKEHAIIGVAEDTLKALTGSSYPMPITSLERDLADILDALTAPPSQPTYYPQPETANQHRFR